MNQDDIFMGGEGDQWFERNRSALHAGVNIDFPLWLIQQYHLNPESVLEIGCSNGWRLAALQERLNIKCVGVEPSGAAIADGKTKYSNVEFHLGTADSIPLTEPFGLVILNFVLHWVARENLFRSIAEIDRLIIDGGFLLIGDFSPDTPTRTFYHHLPEEQVYTFKLDYAAFFVASGLYTQVANFTINHDTHEWNAGVPGSKRGVVTLLRKSYTEFYSEKKSNS